MLIYKDIFTGDELFSDSLPVIDDGPFYKIVGKMTQRKVDFDDALIGANASAEGGDEGADDSGNAQSGIDVVLNHNLQPGLAFPDKKQFTVYFKSFCKKLEAEFKVKKPDDVDAMKERLGAGFKRIKDNIGEYELYTGESMDSEATMAYCLWESPDGGDDVPVFYFFKDSVICEKY